MILSPFRWRKARREDADAALEMSRIGLLRAQARAGIVAAREAGDRDRAAELVAECRRLDSEFEAAADRRRAAKRLLIDHHKEDRSHVS